MLNGPLKSFKHGVLKEIPSAGSQPKTPGTKTMVSVLHKELEYKVEKLKYKKSVVIQPRIKNKSELPVGE